MAFPSSERALRGNQRRPTAWARWLPVKALWPDLTSSQIPTDTSGRSKVRDFPRWRLPVASGGYQGSTVKGQLQPWQPAKSPTRHTTTRPN
jgi:hypothetical protein